MEPAVANTLLDTLIENSLQILRAGFGMNWVESTFFDIILLLRQENALKAPFLEKVRATFAKRDPGSLDVGTVPRELIELVAHELRWRELQELANKRIEQFFGGDTRLAVGDVAHSISKAYDDNWRDREFYQRYRG